MTLIQRLKDPQTMGMKLLFCCLWGLLFALSCLVTAYFEMDGYPEEVRMNITKWFTLLFFIFGFLIGGNIVRGKRLIQEREQRERQRETTEEESTEKT